MCWVGGGEKPGRPRVLPSCSTKADNLPVGMGVPRGPLIASNGKVHPPSPSGLHWFQPRKAPLGPAGKESGQWGMGWYTQQADERGQQCQQCLTVLELLSVPLFKPRLFLGALQNHQPAEPWASSGTCCYCSLLGVEPSDFLVSTHIYPFYLPSSGGLS